MNNAENVEKIDRFPVKISEMRIWYCRILHNEEMERTDRKWQGNRRLPVLLCEICLQDQEVMPMAYFVHDILQEFPAVGKSSPGT